MHRLLSLLFACLLATVAAAADPIEGDIVSTSVSAYSLVLKVAHADGTSTEMTITTTASTKITIDGQQKLLGDLVAGKRAKIELDKGVATSIQVGEAAAAAPAPAPAPEPKGKKDGGKKHKK